VDVCLKCFNGGCCSAELNHSMLHFNQTTHPISLNIKQVLKVVEHKEPA
jgi:ubiquitin carboxyl-terminal hydrolase 5/13